MFGTCTTDKIKALKSVYIYIRRRTSSVVPAEEKVLDTGWRRARNKYTPLGDLSFG